MEVRSGEEVGEAPVFVLRGSVHYSRMDAVVPTVLLAVPLFFAIWIVELVLRSSQTPGSGAAIEDVAGILVVALVFVGVGLCAFRATKNHLAIYKDRLVLDPFIRGPARARLIIPFEAIERLNLSRLWIRVQYGGGTCFSFRGAALHVEDVFDYLSGRVEAVNPGCVVDDPN